MNLNQIESKIQNLVEFHNPFEFIFEFLAAYIFLGNGNQVKERKFESFKTARGNLKKKLFFEELMMDLHETISLIENNHKHDERFSL